MEQITTLISNLGFPIAVCIFLFYNNMRQDEKHSEEISKLSEVIANNTLILKELSERLKNV